MPDTGASIALAMRQLRIPADCGLRAPGPVFRSPANKMASESDRALERRGALRAQDPAVDTPNYKDTDQNRGRAERQDGENVPDRQTGREDHAADPGARNRADLGDGG